MSAPEYLIIPEEIWTATLSTLRPYSEARVEAGLYWYGVRSERRAAVSLVGIPRQTNASTHFEVAANDLAKLVRAIRPSVAVAQVHTHPGAGTEHSPSDDDLALSQNIFSLVLPNYGRAAQLALAAVHEFSRGGWRRMESAEMSRRVLRVPTLVDTRQ